MPRSLIKPPLRGLSCFRHSCARRPGATQGATADLVGSVVSPRAKFIELAPLRDPALVIGTVVRALGIEHLPGQDPLEALAIALRTKDLLVVLDNAKHLRDGTPIFSKLLSRVPRVVLLVTSRIVLHLSGEHVYPVSPLTEETAVKLFHARARQADARFQADAADEQAIRHSCARLDGLPLAIELAAARTRTLPPTALLEGLETVLPLLYGGPRDEDEHVRAIELLDASAALAREVGVRWWESGMLAERASLSLNAGRLEEAGSYALESL